MSARTVLRHGLVMALAFATAASVLLTPSRAEAVEGSDFMPGFIISDTLFFDGGALASGTIDSFIAAKNPGCAIGRTCLENYTENISKRSADARCDAIAAQKNRTAGQIISAVSVACGISPKAILVILQKEQSLVTATAPSERAFAYAMGAGCPDTPEGCNTPYQGLFAQVYYGAWLLKGYTIPGTANYGRYPAGETSAVQYHPNSSCGTKSVTIQNQATHALYVYTPYTPNAAALNNLYGTGDSCSSYGNRNFWRLYNDWFGSTVTDATVYRVDGLTSRWVISGGMRYRVYGDDAEMLSTIRTLGYSTAVSNTYLQTFDDGGTFSGVVAAPNGWYFLLDGKKRYTVRSCDALTELGFDCAAAPALSWEDIRLYASGGDLTSTVKLPDGSLFQLADGVKHEVLDEASAEDAGLDLVDATRLGTRTHALDTVAWGSPVVEEGALFTRPGTTTAYLKRASGLYAIPGELRRKTKIDSWLGGVRGHLSASSVSQLTPVTYVPAAFTSKMGTEAYVLTWSGFARIEDYEVWGATTALDNTFRALIPEVAPMKAPTIIKAAESDTTAVLTADGVFSLLDETHATMLQRASGDAYFVRTVPTSATRVMAESEPLVPAGAVLRFGSSGAKWMIDDDGSRRLIAWQVLDQTTSDGFVQADASMLADYPTRGANMTMGLMCDGRSYIQVGGLVHPVAAGAKAHYKGFGFTPLGSEACAALPHHSKAVGRILASGGKYWFIRSGERIAISKAQAKKWVPTYGAAKSVPASFLALIPVRA